MKKLVELIDNVSFVVKLIVDIVYTSIFERNDFYGRLDDSEEEIIKKRKKRYRRA